MADTTNYVPTNGAHKKTSILKPIIHKFGKMYCQELSKKNYESQQFWRINERVIEYRFVFKALSMTCPKTILDVGSGKTALPSLMQNCGFVVTAIDNNYDHFKKEFFNKHFYVLDDDITNTKIDELFDFITCVSVLEHIDNHMAAVRNMFNLLKPNGYLLLSFPYNENNYIPNVYKLEEAGYGKENPYICQVYSRKELDNWLTENCAALIEQEYWQFFSGEYWTFGEIIPPQQVTKDNRHQLTCLLIQKSSQNI